LRLSLRPVVDAFAPVAARAHRAEADGKPVERAFAQQRAHLVGAHDIEHQAAADMEPARILADRVPHADRFERGMLVEHADLRGRAAAQRRGEGAAGDDVAGAVGHAEEGCITFEFVGGESGKARRHIAPRQRPADSADDGHWGCLSSPVYGGGAERTK